MHVIDRPAGTRGYDDLIRDAVATEAADGVGVEVAALIDLARIAEASPRVNDRGDIVVLRAMRELTSGRGRPAPSPEQQIVRWTSPSPG